MTDLTRRPLVIYHGDCFDGFAAAWAFRHFYGHNVEYHKGRYGEAPPDCKGRRVWLVDFSYPRDILLDKVIIPSMQTTVYDHHKTAEKALEGLGSELWQRGIQRNQDKIVFDMHRSGAGITYDEMEVTHGKKRGFHLPRYNNQRRERLIDYIEDRDLWKFKLEDSKAVSAWISTVPFTFEAYDELADEIKLAPSLAKIVEKGEAIIKYIDLYGEHARAHARMEIIGDYSVPVINVPYMNSSDHIGKLAEEHPESPFAAGYFRRDDGKWQFGLRARGDFDCSEVAKVFGGGGHAAASGFAVDVLPWEPSPQVPRYIVDPKVFEEAIKQPSGVIKIGKPVEAVGVQLDATAPLTGKIEVSETLEAEVEDHPADEEVEFE